LRNIGHYERSERPLLWSIGRQYFYRGELVAEAKGGNIYQSPELIVNSELSLQPIDIDLLIEPGLFMN